MRAASYSARFGHGTLNAPFFWRSGLWSDTTTDPGIAPVYANCHFHRNNLPADAGADLLPFTPAPNGLLRAATGSSV